METVGGNTADRDTQARSIRATPQRAREAGADVVLELARGGKIRAQDAAVKRSRGQIVAFSDANVRWSPDALGELVRPFADARVGYHRGLDALRGAGWRGSGYVRWRHESNRGFLRSLHALELAAAAIGETEEEQRCALFLRQLDPEWNSRVL